ncbi:GTP-binding protein Era [hydrothermal vent metagenome]|uniref:GTP-binding protein Era n=1 Tax=hydrothermal vent metagenome TaxID=652676 RepID=A0A3B0UXL1_9ZZZZ
MNKCGYVAVIGRPNVGKSTLINKIIGEKVSIVTAKPQTTRHQILAIETGKQGQILFIDTPGMHVDHKKALNKYMNKTAAAAVIDVDLILFLVISLKWTADDEQALKALKHINNTPVILVINKADLVKNKEKLLPYANKILQYYDFKEIFYISATTGKGTRDLTNKIYQYLPESENYFAEDQLTDKSTNYLISELIREQLMLRLHQELPYSLTVEIESYKDKGHIVHIHALIWVEREIQKNMVIGKHGTLLKHVGINARAEIQDLIGKKVHLKLWTKVKSAWADNARLLQQLGYKDESL